MSESVSADVLARLDRLESREAIGELCARYCISCDDQDLKALRTVFTDDIIVRSRNGMMNATGLDEVMEMYTGVFAVRGPSFHWTHDRRITFDPDTPDSARGQILAHAETTPNGRPSIAALRYEDVYRREGGRWLIARRELTFLYYVPIEEFISRFPQRERVWAGDRWVSADYPEALGPWSTWKPAWADAEE